ncbi:ATP-binding protein [Amycolatopsis rubida]|uniref:ATP-binding protein n=1 Tax=Amycolatopsis rubida TaxID=112413 RepID=A0ABX0BKN4_9PSEU|nr:MULTISPECIES: ATP-binding protein [Amycolatopsis]MYW90935.1 ATP-binding protein [Amycolatopsis rubida]NEC55920.1 ATP-binding protein [Amycolatopsis rubida]OAP25995.1 hypothetical protein A4R44_03372 [Amycolatopsis sp. M39]
MIDAVAMFSSEAAKLLATALVGRVDKGLGQLAGIARAKFGAKFGSGPVAVADLREQVLAACQDDPVFRTELMGAVALVNAAGQRPSATEGVEPFFNHAEHLRAPRESGTCLVYGPAGSGKTELARQIAGRVRDRFPGGWIEIDVAESRTGAVVDLALVKRQALLKLGIPSGEIAADDAGLDQQFGSVLATRLFTVILDNVVSAREVELFRPFRMNLVLATSAARTRDLDALDPSPILLGGLELEGAREMLAHYCGAVRLDAEPDATGALLAMSGRMPSAIREVGLSLARHGGEPYPVSGLLAHYQANGIVDAEGVINDSLAQTFATLAPETAEAVALLSGFPGHWFTRETAVAYLGMPDEVFDAVVSAMLTEQVGGWHRLTALVSQYAAKLPADRDAAFPRLLSHVRDRAVAADLAGDAGRLREYVVPPGLSWTLPEDRINWLHRHLGLITEVVRAAARRGKHLEVCQLAGALEVLITARWLWREYAEISDLAVRAAAALAEGEPQALYARALSMRAKTWFLARAFDTAAADLQRAWELAEAVDIRPARRERLQSSVAEFRARFFEEQADTLPAERASLLAEAEAWLRKAIALDQHLDHGYALGIHHRMLASVLIKAGRPAEAMAEIENGRKHATGRNLSRLDMVAARAFLARGDLGRARECWSRARAELKSTGADQYQWEVREIEARILAAEGQPEAARTAWGQLIGDAWKLGHPRTNEYITEFESLR